MLKKESNTQERNKLELICIRILNIPAAAIRDDCLGNLEAEHVVADLKQYVETLFENQDRLREGYYHLAQLWKNDVKTIKTRKRNK